MDNYNILFIWMIIFFIITQSIGVYNIEWIDGQKRYRITMLLAIIGIIPFIITAAQRSFTIGDTYSYWIIYNQIPTNINGFLEYISKQNKDVGFFILTGIFKIITNLDFRSYLWFIAIFQGTCLCYVYRKYSSSYAISLFLFFASTDYISWMMNGIRQFFAVCILFLGTKWLFNGNKCYLLLSIFAGMFHQSALLMIPIFFLVQGEPWNFKSLLLITSAILIIFFTNEFTDILTDSIEFTQYNNIFVDAEMFGDNGTNPLRVLIYSIPTIISLLGYRRIRFLNNKEINVCINLSIIGSALYLISMVTSGIFIGRLPIYMTLYNYILLPWEINHLFERNSKYLIYVIMIILYILMFRLQINNWG